MSKIKKQKTGSFRDFFKIPHGPGLRNLLRRLVILLKEQPAIGYEVLSKFQNIIDEMVSQYMDEKLILSKQQYIVIVGNMMISEEIAREIARGFGFSKSNLRFFSNYDLNGDEFDAISSENCIAVIMGPIPHKTVGDFQKAFEQKIIKAQTKSKQLKISKDSIGRAFLQVLQRLKK